jgi:replicative DNA helicase
MLDIILLRIMRYRKEYLRLHRTVGEGTVDPKTKAILNDFGKYFEKFPEHDVVDMQVFLPRFKQWHPNLTDEQLLVYTGMLRQINEDVDECTREGVLHDLYELDLATNIANALKRFEDGDLDTPISTVIAAAVDAYKINRGSKEVPWNETPIEDLLREDLNNEGLQWRLNCLNESMRPLRVGDFGIIAARPDKGKTSFLASEITHMAGQLSNDKNVIWLNNEGSSNPIRKRIYQAALNKTITELSELASESKSKLQSMYAEVVGRADKIRVLDIHGWHVGQVEAVLEQSNPGVVVFDMMDNIRGFKSDAGRTDQRLEAIYQWGREKCTQYGFIGLASSQISSEGKNTPFPALDLLKESKTAKQGACEFQIMIGSVDDANLENMRYIGIPKNKLARDGAPKDPKAEVVFKARQARYEDISHGSY